MSEPHTFTESELCLAYPSVNEKELMELLEIFNWRPEDF